MEEPDPPSVWASVRREFADQLRRLAPPLLAAILIALWASFHGDLTHRAIEGLGSRHIPGGPAPSLAVDVRLGEINAPLATATSYFSGGAGTYVGVVIEVKNTSARAVRLPTFAMGMSSGDASVVPGSGLFVDSAMTAPVDALAPFRGGQNLPDMAAGAVVYVKYRLLLTASVPCGQQVNDNVMSVFTAIGIEELRPSDAYLSVLGRCA